MTTSFRHYLNFDLDISKAEQGYLARVLDSPAGQADVGFTLPFSEAELRNSLALVGGKLRKLTPAAIRDVSPVFLRNPRSFGKCLYESVFTGAVNQVFIQSLAEAKARKAGLRIRLRLKFAPALAALPWEYLYDPQRRRYFCRSINTPIVRYLDLPQQVEPLQVALPLRILVVLSDPSDTLPKLDVESEWKRLESALADLQARHLVVLERLDVATPAELRRRFRQDQAVHILHFIGHGGIQQGDSYKGSIEPDQATSGLLMEEQDGTGRFVPAEELCDILGDQAPRLVFLNACDGAKLVLADPVSGVAQQLVQQGVPSVIAMQFQVTDQAAIHLAQEFYGALAEGNPVDAALAEARKAVAASGSEMEWGTPVLFMRAADGYLFDVAAWLPTPACPYPGMLPYTTADQQKFYGRSIEIEEALLSLRDEPLLVVIGPSGVGKSSLVFAGIVPQLCRASYFGKTEWQVQSMRPGLTPLTTLATTLGIAVQTLKTANKPEEDRQVENPEPASSPAIEAEIGPEKSPVLGRDGVTPLLVIDQFEELFTQSDAVEARDFQLALDYLIRTRQIFIIVTVRADFYEHLLESPLWDAIKDHRLELKPLDAQGLREAILQPAEAVDVQIDPALVERLLVDAANEPGVMPLIQETLVLLWDRVKNRFLPVNVYTDLTRRGPKRTGLQVAIARRADRTLHALAANARPIAQRVFLRLVQFGEGRNDTRRQQPICALQAVGDDEVLFDATIGHLVASRLLTITGEEQTADDKVDIAHEALITGWPTFQAWLTKSRKAEQIRRELEAKASEWERRQRQGALLDHLEWQEAQAWLQSDPAGELGCSQSLCELVQASHLALRRQKLAHRLTQAAGVAILLLVGLASFWGLRSIAVAEEGERSESRRIANVAFQQLWVDPVRSLREATARLPDTAPKPYVPEIESVAYQALQVNLQRSSLDLSSLRAAGKVLTAAQIQPGNAWLAVGGTQLWLVALTMSDTLTQSNVISLTGHTAPVTAVQWNRTGDTLLSRDPHHLRLWQDTQPHGELSFDNAVITCAAWRPNHDQIAVCSGNAVLLWSPTDNTTSKIASLPYTVTTAIWSPEGRWLTLWDVENGEAPTQTVVVWDAEQQALHFSRQIDKNNYIRLGAWSPDEQSFVAVSSKEVQLWAMNDPEAEISITKRVMGVAFVDNASFVTWSPKDQTRRWSLADGTEIQAYGSDQDNVQGIQLSPDRTQLLTFAGKGADLWDLATGVRGAALCCHARPIRAASWRDGRYLATAGKDGTVRIWDLDNSQEVITLRGHKGRNASGRADVFNALWLDAQTLLTYGEDGTVRRWQIFDEQGEPLCNGVDRGGIPLCHQFSHTFAALPGEVRSLQWVDGAFMALSINQLSGTLQQTHLSTNTGLTRTFALSNSLFPLVLTPDGQFFIQQGEGETQFVELASGSSIRLQGASTALSAAALAPDGRLATADHQGMIQLWSLPDGVELTHFGQAVAPPEQSPVWEMRWTADGRSLLTAGRRVARWEVASGKRVWQSADDALTVHFDLSQDERLLAATLGVRFVVFDTETGEICGQNVAHDQPIGGIRWVQAPAWPNQDRHWAWIDGLARRLVGRLPNPHTERQLILTWSGDGTVRLWDWQAEVEVRRMSEAGPIIAAAISPDGAQIISAALLPSGDPGPLRLWQTWLPDPIGLTEIAHSRFIGQ